MEPQAPTAVLVDPIIGQTIGNYRVSVKVGEGGMGSVYLAEHPQIGKRVALKVLHAEFASNPDVVSRFFNEAKAVNDIGHPNIVDVIDYGVLTGQHASEKFVYFIMEYLAGQTLAQLVRAESPLPPERALTIALQCADALSASHRCEIVHRDLKPDNIILQQRGRERDFVKLLDFGIAKLTGEQHGSNRTRTGIVMGTPAYMSPEQCEGKGNVDHRTDIYALGIVLYEMLTGRVPFIGDGYGEILIQHLTQSPISPSKFRVLPPHVEAVVLKALEKDPENRYPNMDEFMRAMSNPVGFVDAHGGVTGFLRARLMPSVAGTPLPNLFPSALTPAPGSLGVVPAATVPPLPGKSKTVPIVIGGIVVIAGIAIGAVAMKSGKSSDAGPGTSGSNKASAAVVAEVIPDAPPKPIDAAPKPIDAAVRTVVVVDAAVDAAAAKISLTVTTTPAGADIIVGDKTGKSPFTIELDPAIKSVKVTAKLAGFDVRSETVALTPSADPLTRLTRDWKLKRKTGVPPVKGSGDGNHDGDGIMKPGDM
jgi:eukaryotic-like serine/threonine-protein kinase